MPDLSPERQRALRRRHKHERQAVVFGTLVALLLLAGLTSAAVYTGALDLPFLDKEFTTPPAEATTDLPDPPCPPDGTLPVAYNAIQVSVLNGSGESGLAGQTATSLTERGFAVLGTGNYPVPLAVPAQISFGQAGLASAYTLAAHLDRPVLLLDTRADASVDLALGTGYTGLLDPASIVLDPAVALTPAPGCVPLALALADAVAPPAPAGADATPTTEAPAVEETPAAG
jgi:hypothetical protein